MEEDFHSINNDISLSRALSVMIEEGIPAQDERWSPDGSDEDTCILAPQADRTGAHMKYERESTGRAPERNLKKQRNDDYELNVSLKGRLLP
eukprot:7962082-Pyramimonas_sp.AAC.1